MGPCSLGQARMSVLVSLSLGWLPTVTLIMMFCGVVVFPWHLFPYFSFSFPFSADLFFQPGVMPPVVAFAVGEC
jgi:hypothetical protein